jgi:type IV pilus assembly protein PilN
MIKINLLAEKKKKTTKTRSEPRFDGESSGSGRNVVLIGVLMIGLLAAGGWWWSLDRSIDDWQAKIEAADQELIRLEAAIKKSEEFEAQKDLLTRKITLITDLKKQQSVPVHILDQISRSLPDFLWLESMGANNNRITISGKATTYAAVMALCIVGTQDAYQSIDRWETFLLHCLHG